MSRIKPIFRELRQSVLSGFAHSRDKLHQLADNFTEHFDTVVREIRGIDNFDDLPDKPGARTPGSDRLIPRPECLDGTGEIDWSKAPHNGFTLDANGNPIMRDHVPRAGDRFDRYGHPEGLYVSPIGEDGPFSYASRSLPYAENPNAYHAYEWRHSPADVQSVYDGLDGPTRAAVDDTLAKYDLDLSDLSRVTRGEAAAIPEWGTPGGATQDLLPVTVDLLDKMGMIKEVS